MSGLDRFIKAQEGDYDRALKEIKNGRKQSCWMWYIFPQIIGLGSTSMAKEYAIKNIEEAIEYLNNDILKNRLVEISQALLDLEEDKDNIREIMGYPDDLKLRSSMTLFKKAEELSEIKCDNIFQKVLDKFYNGEDDNLTLNILYKQNLDKNKEKKKDNKKIKDESESESESKSEKENEKESNKENINNNVRNENSGNEEDDKDKIAHLDSIPTISSEEFITQNNNKDNIQNDNQNNIKNNNQNNTPNDIQNNVDLPESEIKKHDNVNNKKKEKDICEELEEQKNCMEKFCNFDFNVNCIII